jgi:hypothetical protein
LEYWSTYSVRMVVVVVLLLLLLLYGGDGTHTKATALIS